MPDALEGGLPVLSRLVRSFTGLFADGAVDPERRNAVLLIGGISFVVLFSLGLIAFGYYRDRIEPRRDPVVRVGDRTFSYDFVERRIKSDVAQGRFDINDVVNSIARSVAVLQQEELVRIVARERGVEATDEEVDAAIREELGLAPNVSHDELAAVLRQHVLRIRLPLDDYLEIVEARVLGDKIKQALADAVPAQAEQVNLLLIQAGSQARAILAKRSLDAGRPFAEVASEYAAEGGGTNPEGAFGWATRELLDPELADVAFSISGRSDIIETESDFYIIEVLGKEERPVEDSDRSEIATKEFDRLVDAALASTPFVSNLTPEQILRIAGAIGALRG